MHGISNFKVFYQCYKFCYTDMIWKCQLLRLHMVWLLALNFLSLHQYTTQWTYVTFMVQIVWFMQLEENNQFHI